MANVTFHVGEAANLSKLQQKDGQFIVISDERAIFVDVGGERIRIGDFRVVDEVKNLPPAGADGTALYYCKKENILARWDAGPEYDGGWVQINPDTGAIHASVEGEEDGILTASYDEDSRTIKITVSEKLATDSGVTEKIAALDDKFAEKTHTHETTDITDFDTEMAKKADATEFQSLQTKVGQIETQIGGLSGAMHFRGIVDEDPTTMATEGYNEGDVVVYGDKEFILQPADPQHEIVEAKFVELGDVSEVGSRVTKLETWQTEAKETLDSLGTTYAKKSEVDEQFSGLESVYAKSTQVTADIQSAKSELIGEDGDASEQDTIHAAKNFAKEQVEALNISQYAKSSDLQNYVKTETLDTYATDDDVSTAISDALTWQQF